MSRKDLSLMFKKAFAVIISFFFLIGSYTLDAASELTPTNTSEFLKHQNAVLRLIRGFESFEESIDISEYGIPPENVGKVFADATKNSPYLFYVGNHLSYTYRKGENVISLIPQYECTEEEARARVEFCKSEIKKLAALADLGQTPLHKAEIAHDLICLRYKYDLTLVSGDLYSFLSSGTGTCQGYTWAYMAVLRELGIECEYVASDKIVHIWLKLKIDGEWYNSDVTWDDPPSEEGRENGVIRRHFLFSDKKAEADGCIERYSSSDQNCVSEKYDSEMHASYHVHGDVDHNGRVELSDIIELRRYVELFESSGDICVICAELSRDMMLDDFDTDALRDVLLDSP